MTTYRPNFEKYSTTKAGSNNQVFTKRASHIFKCTANVQTMKLQLYCKLNASIEIINNKARHNVIDAKCRRRSDQLDGAGSFWEPLGQTQVMQIRQGETPNPQGAKTHDFSSLSCQYRPTQIELRTWMYYLTSTMSLLQGS